MAAWKAQGPSRAEKARAAPLSLKVRDFGGTLDKDGLDDH